MLLHLYHILQRIVHRINTRITSVEAGTTYSDTLLTFQSQILQLCQIQLQFLLEEIFLETINL